MNVPARVLRVFLSSTALDLAACREKVRDTVLQLEQLPVGLETFTALPMAPAPECQKKAAEADVVVVMVAHRYGYVPPEELGGDGKHSITWLEVLAAKQAGKPVFAFLIDSKAMWGCPKESDLLNDAPDEKHAEILAAVKGLREFKAYLQAHCTCETFLGEDDLARKVATTLSRHTAGLGHGSTPGKRVWRPRVCYPLQPAPHFRGRGALLEQLTAWARAPVSADRVVSLVAMGGTGKTALAERVLAGVGEGDSAGVLVWSFYESPRTEEFLRAACEYFTGEVPATTGLLERLQTALSGDEAHLMVLDGLERVQAEGATGRPRGELEDPQMRRLLRWVAAGQGTRARALVTSRFPLVDLSDWKTAGHREERLEDLEPEAARSLLRGWGVKGDDGALNRLAGQVGHHALTLAVLGSYLKRFWEGDPAGTPTFDHQEVAAVDQKAAKLHRVLTSYAAQLAATERDLLARLSIFPRGVTLDLLGALVGAGGEVAGALAGCTGPRLRFLLEGVRDLGLVYRYDTRQGATYSAHPFLRSFFQELLGATRSEDIHATVRQQMAPSLVRRPGTYPSEEEELERYEAFVEHTRLAGYCDEAFGVYWSSMGGYAHLGRKLGENIRGMRMLSGFLAGNERALPAGLGEDNASRLLTEMGYYARNLGDLHTAEHFHKWALAHDGAGGPATSFPDGRPGPPKGRVERRGGLTEADVLTDRRNLAEIALLRGHLPQALKLARQCLSGGRSTGGRDPRESDEANVQARTLIGMAAGLLGKLGEASNEFGATTAVQFLSYSMHAAREAEFQLLRGKRSRAKKLLRKIQGQWYFPVALGEVIEGRLLVGSDPGAARDKLSGARARGSQTGDVEIQLCAHLLAAEIFSSEGDHAMARAEAESGLHLADTCGFGRYSIELRVALARALLEAGEAIGALQRAEQALERSSHPECQYAWGEADALHICGIAHARLGQRDQARKRLSASLDKRTQLTHPGLDETRRALVELGR